MEFNIPVSNPLLVGAIQVMKAEDTPEHRNLFLSEMVKARYLAPVMIDPQPEPDDKGKLRLTPSNKVQFPRLIAPDGKSFFIAFSDKTEYASWKDEKAQHTFALTFQDYAGMVLGPNSKAYGFIINPYGGNIVITREMIAALLAPKQ